MHIKKSGGITFFDRKDEGQIKSSNFVNI
jgi:hypothetical protein